MRRIILILAILLLLVGVGIQLNNRASLRQPKSLVKDREESTLLDGAKKIVATVEKGEWQDTGVWMVPDQHIFIRNSSSKTADDAYRGVKPMEPFRAKVGDIEVTSIVDRESNNNFVIGLKAGPVEKDSPIKQVSINDHEKLYVKVDDESYLDILVLDIVIYNRNQFKN